MQATSEKYSEQQRKYNSFFFTLYTLENWAKKQLLKKKLVPSLGKICALGR